MTRDEAIKQLDWYFDYDNGGAAEDKTKEAYSIIRNIAFEYAKYEGKRKRLFSDTIVCPVCGGLASWNSYFGRYICSSCGWESLDK